MRTSAYCRVDRYYLYDVMAGILCCKGVWSVCLGRFSPCPLSGLLFIVYLEGWGHKGSQTCSISCLYLFGFLFYFEWISQTVRHDTCGGIQQQYNRKTLYRIYLLRGNGNNGAYSFSFEHWGVIEGSSVPYAPRPMVRDTLLPCCLDLFDGIIQEKVN